MLDKAVMSNPVSDRASPDSTSSYAPCRSFNIGNKESVELMVFIDAIDNAVGKQSVRNILPMQRGNVVALRADVVDMNQPRGFALRMLLSERVRGFVAWYLDYYSVRA